MLKYDSILIRFGELNTKGKNKNDFIKLLYKNLQLALEDIPSLEFIRTHDRIYVKHSDNVVDQLIERIKKVSGIASFSRVYQVQNEIEEIKNGAFELVSKENAKTFKVKARRADKTFPIHSDDINRIVATHILKNTEYKVDVHAPDLLLNIEVRKEGTFLFSEKILGAGGYPLGIAGKGLVMMSGGIDSPVAAHLAMNRGIKIEAIHFASPPYTSEQAKHKVIDLLKVLSEHKLPIKLHIVPFTKLQEAIYEHVDESYAITIMRRMMYRIAEKLARRRNCMVLINGESIGQVASQTLHSMQVINEVVKMPVIRPLATTDKMDIMEIAKKIGTFDISIRPFIDCCTIFTPKNPVTRPESKVAEEYESKFDYMSLINEAIYNIEAITVDSNYQIVENADEFF